MTREDKPAARHEDRRRFALYLTPVAIVLIVGGVLWSDSDGVLGAIGLVALAQGLGLAVALVPLAFGRNPLDRDRK